MVSIRPVKEFETDGSAFKGCFGLCTAYSKSLRSQIALLFFHTGSVLRSKKLFWAWRDIAVQNLCEAVKQIIFILKRQNVGEKLLFGVVGLRSQG